MRCKKGERDWGLKICYKNMELEDRFTEHRKSLLSFHTTLIAPHTSDDDMKRISGLP